MPEKVFKKIDSCILPQWKSCFFAGIIVGLIAHLYKITNYEVSPSEASRNYVSCIADFNGVLNQEEISYLCTILGTNN